MEFHSTDFQETRRWKKSGFNLSSEHTKNEVTATLVKKPAVFRTPICSDIINFIYPRPSRKKQATSIDMQSRLLQVCTIISCFAFSILKFCGISGHQTSAESRGTGEAVARIPHVQSGGTHRWGRGAFGNMSRGGWMFALTKTWRNWHRRVNVARKRSDAQFALLSPLPVWRPLWWPEVRLRFRFRLEYLSYCLLQGMLSIMFRKSPRSSPTKSKNSRKPKRR